MHRPRICLLNLFWQNREYSCNYSYYNPDHPDAPWCSQMIMMKDYCLQVDNLAYSFWMAVFFLGQVAGFIAGFHRNDHGQAFEVQGWSLPIAKGSAQAIQVLCFLLLKQFKCIRACSSSAWKVGPLQKLPIIYPYRHLQTFPTQCLDFCRFLLSEMPVSWASSWSWGIGATKSFSWQ